MANTTRRGLRTALWSAVVIAGVVAGGQAALLLKRGRPPADEFGAGPRTSLSQTYRAMLILDEPLRPRKLQTVQVVITDRDGHPVDGATIGIGGGMPQHGHGLPTQPRLSRALGGGTYEIEGLRFNMGGWWELRLAISSPAGADIVTFNLAL